MNDEHAQRFSMDNPYHALIGVELVERGEGYARCRLPVTDRLGSGYQYCCYHLIWDWERTSDSMA